MSPLNAVLWGVITLGLAFLLGWSQEYAKGRKMLKIGVWTGAILVLIVVRWFAPFDFGPSSWADVADWIMPDGYARHSVETLITVQGDWIVGEAKDCSSLPLNFKAARLIGEEPGYVALGLNCDDGPRHSVKTTLYGRLNQPEHRIAYWRCTRKSEGFTCRQTGSE
jgi:hypothetical protein